MSAPVYSSLSGLLSVTDLAWLEKNQMKPKVLVCVLCSIERTGWVAPPLCLSLIQLQQDPRFDCRIRMVTDAKPVEHARNLCVFAAREGGADVLVQIDNDMTLPANFADILHDAYRTGKAVVSLPSGILPPEGPQMIPGDNGKKDGQFRVTGCAGAGVLVINSEVWRAISGPWFKWLANDDEVLSRKLSEDYYFCGLVQRHGLTVWTHERVAGHLKTVNATQWTLNLKRLEKSVRDLDHKPGDVRALEHLNLPAFVE